MDKLPDVSKNLWRGIQRDIDKNYEKGDIVTWWGVSSCSPSVDVIKGFLTRSYTIFMIEAVKGKDISRYSSYPHEKEVLLRPATRLRVVANALDSPSIHLVHLKEISDQSQPSQPASTVIKSTTTSSTFEVLTDKNGNRYDAAVYKLHS